MTKFPGAMQLELFGAVKDTLFDASVQTLFGAPFVNHHGCAPLQKAFYEFEEGFEMAASPVPHFLQPTFCKARTTLLAALR